jgi:hypothetical protein
MHGIAERLLYYVFILYCKLSIFLEHEAVIVLSKNSEKCDKGVVFPRDLMVN